MKIDKNVGSFEMDDVAEVLQKLGMAEGNAEEMKRLARVMAAVWHSGRSELLEELEDADDAVDYEPAVDFIRGNGFAK